VPAGFSLSRATVLLATIGLLVLAACQTTSSGSPAASSGGSTAEGPSGAPTTGDLTVIDWFGYETTDWYADFAAAYPDVKVNFDLWNSDAEVYQSLKGGTPADIVHPYTGWLKFYVDEGLVQPIDTSKLKNWDKVRDDLKALGEYNGKQYFIPWDWGFSSVLYRTDKIATVDSWDALLSTDACKHISMWDDGPGAVTVSSYIHDYEETAITDAQLADIQAEWRKQRDCNLFYWSTLSDLEQGFINDEVWVAYAWQGSYAVVAADGTFPVAYADPKEGRNSWVGMYGITSDTKNLDLALAFLDGKLGDETSAHLVNDYYYGTSNKDVMAGITDQNLIDAFSLNDPTVLQRTNFTPDITADQRDAWTTMWTEVQSGP